MPPKSSSPSGWVAAGSRRNSASSHRSAIDENGGVPGRVRVAVRLRPRNAEEIVADVDFADCVELQPELKRLKLRKNIWDCETYQFDEVLTETSSQKRVYEVVAKPVVESVCQGYNGTVMAYGQTGTGKTFTLGSLGEEDVASRGIMVRALEDILANASSAGDIVTVSYLQLYMETVQDLLAPEKGNVGIVEDPKTGDISVPGATQVELTNQRSFVQLLQAGEANRFAANTKLNTESSRSHAILVVNVKRPAKSDRQGVIGAENGTTTKNMHAPVVRKSKLLIVDLAGSERVDKSGSEGHTLEEAKSINLSLTALGKCINALAENSQHVPIRDSKLTRILRDSFGGTARTSLIVTIGPSPRHRGETASTIGFGQRAMKVENMVKLKEEFDYKSLCWRLEAELDRLVAENERQVKARQDEGEELERKLKDSEDIAIGAESKFVAALKTLEAEKDKLQREHAEMVQKLKKAEKEIKGISQDQQEEKKERLSYMEKLKLQRELTETIAKHQRELAEEKQRQLQELEDASQKLAIERFEKEKLEKELKDLSLNFLDKEVKLDREVQIVQQQLEEERKHREELDEEVRNLREHLLVLSDDGNDKKKTMNKVRSGKMLDGLQSPTALKPPGQVRSTINGQRASIAKLFEQVGLQKILSLLESEDVDVRIHAVKVVANLAAEEANQEKIVEAGGLGSLLLLLLSSEDETVRRVAAGAVANLAMNETNQELIMTQGGIGLLAKTAHEAEDPQTLRMAAGAIANLCGNDKLQIRLREEGGIRALLGMVKSCHPDVLAQVARGIANFAKCESRGAAQGYKSGRSLLIDDGALPWIVANANNDASPIRRHIELALCHLAQHEENSKDLVAGGALWELVRISRECSREDIRNLAQRTLNASNIFQTELSRLQMV